MSATARSRSVGPERVLLAGYLVFVVAAGARSIVQLGTHAGRAPLAYLLSLAAAVIYAAGFTLVRRVGSGDLRVARALRWCSVTELAGVLAVGTWSVLDAAAFPDASVWSYYGAGYLCVPVMLPMLVLWWLRGR